MVFTFRHGDQPLRGYTILRGVGRGGFGEVYYAVSDAGKEVALKYLRDNPEVELRGVTQCMNLKSPHLVTIFDVQRNDDGEYFIIMEYVNGPSLRDLLIAEPGGLGVQKASFFAREIGKGLSYLHERGIIHRDLKPGNIFYEEGYVKIGDYGLSKFISPSRHSAQTASVGTVHYMAPEVGSGHYHRGIDIYALGVILYEMLLGRVPFEGSTMGEVLMKHLTAQPKVDELPEPFPHVIRKALAKDPNERYQTVDEMIEEILGVEAVRNSVASFEPASLRLPPRHEMETIPAAGPAPAPTPQRAAPAGATVSERLARRVEQIRDRVSEMGPQASQRLRRVAAEIKTPAPPATGPTALGRARWLIAFFALLGTGALVALLAEEGGSEGRMIGCGILYVLAIVVSASTAARILGRATTASVPTWVSRLVTVGAGLVPFALAGGIAKEALHQRALAEPTVLLIMLAILGLCDWVERVRVGALGSCQIGAAFNAGLCGLIAGAVAGMEDLLWFPALVAAGGSLAVQATAWFLPPPRLGRAVLAYGQTPPAGDRYARIGFALVVPRTGRTEELLTAFLERHGYQRAHRGPESLVFVRGSRAAARHRPDDVTALKTKLTIALGRDTPEVVELNCHYEIYTAGQPLTDAAIAHLEQEMHDLRTELLWNAPPNQRAAAENVQPRIRPLREPAAHGPRHPGTETPPDYDAPLYSDQPHAPGAAFQWDAPPPGRAPRWTLTRIFWGFWAAMFAIGGTLTILASQMLTTEQMEEAGMIAGGAACFVLMVFALTKTTTYRHRGLWREWIRPFLLALFGAGLAACGVLLGLWPHSDTEARFGFLAGVVSLAILWLLVALIPGRRRA